jgi:hypothetical protein
VMATLLAPHTIEELLDRVADPDHEILVALQQLVQAGKVRRIPKGAVRVALADPEQMAVLGALASRLRPPGYAGPARIVVAATMGTLATLAHSLQRIAEAASSGEVAPRLPLAYRLGAVKFSEGAELEVVGLPTVETFSPTWGLALGGCAAAVRLDLSGGEVLEEACAVSGVPLLDAEALLGTVDEADPAQIAALVRATLDAVAGG